MSDVAGYLEGAAIGGLVWLVNAPKFEAIVIDERGYPVRVATIDPRVFALHKSWVAAREDRDPLKTRRDLAQAKAVAVLATKYLRLSFDHGELSELPLALRALSADILPNNESGAPDALMPNW